MIPKKIIDNSDIKLSTILHDDLKAVPNTQFDIATAFFNIQAHGFIKGGGFFLGKATEVRSGKTIGDALLKMIRKEVECLSSLRIRITSLRNL